MILSDEDRRVLAAVAMGLVDIDRYHDSFRGIRGAYSIGGHDVTEAVRRLMAEQLVMYLGQHLALIPRKTEPEQ